LPAAQPKPDHRLPAPPGAAATRTTRASATLALASPSQATPVPEQVQAKVPVGKSRSAVLALLLSLGGTIASYAALIGASGIAADSEEVPNAGASDNAINTAMWGLVIVGGVGLVVAPSLGHWYAGKYIPRGMWMRLASLVAVAGGIGMQFAPGEEIPTAGVLPIIVGVGLFLSGTVDDIITAPLRARRYKRERGVVITPLVTQSSAGLALSGRF